MPYQAPIAAIKKPSELLDCAADTIQERGFVKRKYFEISREEGPCCTVGALAVCSARELGSLYDIKDKVIPYLPATAREIGIVAWNDQKSQTKGRVVSALRKAAEKAREAGQ